MNDKYFVLGFLTIIMLAALCEAKDREQKPEYAVALCGNAFVVAWQKVCQMSKLKTRSRKGRSIEEMVKPRTIDILSSNEARQFLNKGGRFRRQLNIGGRDNASEECCAERCTIQEILEYKC